jgi:trehalose 6-phosphate phosphatase
MHELIHRLKERAASAGVYLDFDGTLSEIVDVPSEARPSRGVPSLLSRLATSYRLVAVVSGRSAKQLAEWLGPEVEIWGLHGAERSVGGRIHLAEAARPYERLMDVVLREVRAAVGQRKLDGVAVEDKGVMLGLHYRTAVDRGSAGRALEEIAREMAARHGLRIATARMAFELRPPVEFSKSRVILERSREEALNAIAFAGDDSVDLPGFDALDELALDGLVTVRVAVRSPEAPDDLLRRADLVVDGPPGMVTLLEELAGNGG